jgi:hypothetical protein
MSTSPFSGSYQQARARFRSAAVNAGAALFDYAYPESGPDGGDLATDIAWLGPRSAEHVLVTVSGTHGVEGYGGSGAQVHWLERGEGGRLPPGAAAMLVHAINPHGFAWHRRVTHENVDLNRNWIDFSAAPPENPGYAQIAAALCPSQWTQESRARSMAELQAFIAKHSLATFVQVVSGGQYTHPEGLFYGGAAPTLARRNLTAILREHLGQAEHIACIDYHTGLGPAGYGERMVADSREGAVFARACQWLGTEVTSVATGDSASAKIAGGWIGALPGLLPHAEVTAIGLEFGTVEPLFVLEALRADNWLHTCGDPAAPQAQPIKAAMLEAFYIDTDLWRGMVLGQSLLACRQMLAGLTRR